MRVFYRRFNWPGPGFIWTLRRFSLAWYQDYNWRLWPQTLYVDCGPRLITATRVDTPQSSNPWTATMWEDPLSLSKLQTSTLSLFTPSIDAERSPPRGA